MPGSSTTSYTVSPMHLRVPTLGDLLKQQSPQSLNVAVAGKDRAAVMMGGHTVDQRWYWDGKTFVTDNKSAAIPSTITKANNAIAAAIATARQPLQSPPVCQAKSAPIAVSPELTVGAGTFAPRGWRRPGLSRFARVRRCSAGDCGGSGPGAEARP